jgi:hypothetical protein
MRKEKYLHRSLDGTLKNRDKLRRHKWGTDTGINLKAIKIGVDSYRYFCERYDKPFGCTKTAELLL